MNFFKDPDQSILKFSDLEAIIKQLTKTLKSQKIEKYPAKFKDFLKVQSNLLLNLMTLKQLPNN